MKESANTLVPQRLEAARKRLNITKAEAARRIGLTAASYVRYEAGDRSPSPQVLATIAEKLSTSVAYLTGRTEDFSPDSISISKATSPILFKLVEFAQNSDEATLQRLLSYYHQLIQNN